MNASLFSALLLISSAPVIEPDAPLAIVVTPEGRRKAARRATPIVSVRRPTSTSTLPQGKLPNAAARGERNIGMENEPEEYTA